jgi:PAS domain S-box-containing protein
MATPTLPPTVRDEEDAELLKAAVNEAARLLDSDGAMIYLYDSESGELHFAYDAGVTNPEAQQMLRDLRLPIGRGMFGSALERGELVSTDNYPEDDRFAHHGLADRIVAAAEMRSMAAAPMFANQDPLGVLGAFSSRLSAFSPQQLSILRSLADHAAAAIDNRHLLRQLRDSEEQLRRQAAELERTVAAHRALDEIARRIVDVADASEVLQQVVDTASRLLGSDGAHLTLMNDESNALVPIVMAGHTEPGTRAWLRSQRFPLGGGINGLAAATGSALWTENYRLDPRWPHDPQDDSVDRLELGAVVVAPLFEPGADVIGTLAITYREPRPIDPRDVTLLEELARQASIAARNARLYAELRERTSALEVSESRYRNLVDHSPDLVWAVDGQGRLTYIGETLERLTGFQPDTVIGRPWTTLLTPESVELAQVSWAAILQRPDEEQQLRVQTPLAGGGAMTAEINMIGTVTDGQFAGAHGSLRDITERERLAEDLRRRSAELAANEERASLARELHDSVTQALFSMGLTLRTIELLFDRDSEAARAKFAELRELQDDALAEMRTLIFELRPRGLETDGLAQALRNHATAVAGRTGLAITVDTNLETRLPLDTEEALYRIGQEALHNVVKHANATSAQLALRLDSSEIQLTVSDDGTGFDPTMVSGTKLGLIAMRQRAERLGGRVEISSEPGVGTSLKVTVPVQIQQPEPAASAE